jgi:hypothetical protein
MIGYLSQRRGRGFKSRRHSTGCVVDERPKSLKRRLAPTLLVPLLTPRRAAQAWAHAARRGFHVKRRAESQSVTCRASRLVVQDRTPGEGLASCRHRSTGEMPTPVVDNLARRAACSGVSRTAIRYLVGGGIAGSIPALGLSGPVGVVVTRRKTRVAPTLAHTPYTSTGMSRTKIGYPVKTAAEHSRSSPSLLIPPRGVTTA